MITKNGNLYILIKPTFRGRKQTAYIHDVGYSLMQLLCERKVQKILIYLAMGLISTKACNSDN